jgi:hypothetical protein
MYQAVKHDQVLAANSAKKKVNISSTTRKNNHYTEKTSNWNVTVNLTIEDQYSRVNNNTNKSRLSAPTTTHV